MNGTGNIYNENQSIEWRRVYVQKSDSQTVFLQVGCANYRGTPAVFRLPGRLYEGWPDQLSLALDTLRYTIWYPQDVLLDWSRWNPEFFVQNDRSP